MKSSFTCATRLYVVCLAALLGVVLFGCTATDEEAGQANQPSLAIPCDIGTLDTAGTFIPYQSGDQAELVVGFQGFMLVIVRAHSDAGELPYKPKVRMVVTREDGPPSVSTLVHAASEKDAQGHSITESLEMWLHPPDPNLFVGKRGTLSVELTGRPHTCQRTVDVVFVDNELCKHTEDGKVFCADGSEKKH